MLNVLASLMLLAQATSGGTDSINISGDVPCAPDTVIAQGARRAGFDEKLIEPLSDKILLHFYVDKNGQCMLALSNSEGTNCLIGAGNNWYGEGKGANDVQ